MRGYLIHHRSSLYEGIRADYYHNDPYVWFSPYLWSFCHLNQHPLINKGMKILWLSKANNTFVCDLVFVVGEIMPYQEAKRTFGILDTTLAQDHFCVGEQHHPEVQRENAKTYLANIACSYIPHPAISLEVEINTIRQRENFQAKLLTNAWGRMTTPLKVAAIDELEQIVFERASKRMTGKLQANMTNK